MACFATCSSSPAQAPHLLRLEALEEAAQLAGRLDLGRRGLGRLGQLRRRLLGGSRKQTGGPQVSEARAMAGTVERAGASVDAPYACPFQGSAATEPQKAAP